MTKQDQEHSPSRFEGDKQHGWAEDVGTVGGGAAGREADRKAFEGPPEGSSNPPREVSDEERDGVPPTDTEATSAHGVGESLTRRGEDHAKGGDEEGRTSLGTKGATERPYGTSDAKSATGVNPKDPIDPESPNLSPA